MTLWNQNKKYTIVPREGRPGGNTTTDAVQASRHGIYTLRGALQT